MKFRPDGCPAKVENGAFYFVSIPSCFSFCRASAASCDLRVLVQHVLKLHDSLCFLADADVRVALLQQRARDLVGLRVVVDHGVKLLDGLADISSARKGSRRSSTRRCPPGPNSAFAGEEVAEALDGQVEVAALVVAVGGLVGLHRVCRTARRGRTRSLARRMAAVPPAVVGRPGRGPPAGCVTRALSSSTSRCACVSCCDDLVEPVGGLLDGALRGLHALFDLGDLGHERGVRLQQRLGLLGDARRSRSALRPCSRPCA